MVLVPIPGRAKRLANGHGKVTRAELETAWRPVGVAFLKTCVGYAQLVAIILVDKRCPQLPAYIGRPHVTLRDTNLK